MPCFLIVLTVMREIQILDFVRKLGCFFSNACLFLCACIVDMKEGLFGFVKVVFIWDFFKFYEV